jgi:hypothetical protein
VCRQFDSVFPGLISQSDRFTLQGLLVAASEVVAYELILQLRLEIRVSLDQALLGQMATMLPYP